MSTVIDKDRRDLDAAQATQTAQPSGGPKNALHRVLRVVLDAVLILIVVFALAVVGAAIYVAASGGQSTIFGYSFEVVASGSMSPTISTGDLIVVKEESTYAQGDVVTYRDSSGSLITHRIIGATDNGQFITKGDANNTQDKEAVSQSQIVGELMLVIPGGEAVVNFARQPIVLGVLVFALALLVLMPFVISRGR
jgi:signal peptidase